MTNPISLAVLLERFFAQRLMQQRQASPHTISSRDTFSQFLKFSEQRLNDYRLKPVDSYATESRGCG